MWLPTRLVCPGNPSVWPRASEVRTDNLKIVGIEPDQVPPPPTAAQKVARAAKAQATRTARGTKGKSQTAQIHGQVPAAAPAATPAAAGPTKTGT